MYNKLTNTERMSKKTLAQKLTVDWTEIYLEAQRALNYLEENKTAPVKSAHKVLALNVKKSTNKIIKLTGASAGNGA